MAKPASSMLNDLQKANISVKYLRGPMAVDFVSMVQCPMNSSNGPPIMALNLNISILLMGMFDSIFRQWIRNK